MREYIPNLIGREKWDQSARQLQIGDQVLIMDENTKRGEWLTGFVISTHPSSDGVVRKATVQTARSALIRPVVKLCFIAGGQQS